MLVKRQKTGVFARTIVVTALQRQAGVAQSLAIGGIAWGLGAALQGTFIKPKTIQPSANWARVDFGPLMR